MYIFLLLYILANPEALINSVYFNNSMHFGLRGRHEHEQMLWGDVELKISASGQEYLEFTERATKTRNGISGDTRPFAPKMFSKPGKIYMYSYSITSTHTLIHSLGPVLKVKMP